MPSPAIPALRSKSTFWLADTGPAVASTGPSTGGRLAQAVVASDQVPLAMPRTTPPELDAAAVAAAVVRRSRAPSTAKGPMPLNPKRRNACLLGEAFARSEVEEPKR